MSMRKNDSPLTILFLAAAVSIVMLGIARWNKGLGMPERQSVVIAIGITILTLFVVQYIRWKKMRNMRREFEHHTFELIIAVDGPTASGKGTIAKALAAHFELPCLDTGLLYRAVGRQVALNSGDADDPADALAGCDFPDALLDDAVLRSEESGGLASQVSVHPAVREALYERQRAFALQAGGAVLDGRDIGTVIMPEAPVKLFVTASVESRAQRRFAEMQERGITTTIAEIEEDLRRRDERDSTRAAAPLKPAKDAHILDTSNLPREQAIQAAIDLARAATDSN